MAMHDTLEHLDRGGGAIRVSDPEVERLLLQAMGPASAASVHALVPDRRLRRPAASPVLSPAHTLRELLYACVHPGLPPDRQSSMLLRFGLWLPNDAAAAALQTGPSTVGIHLRQCCRRLSAVARRGGRAGSAGEDARGLTLLRLFDGLRQRGAELQASSPDIAAAIDTDTRMYASLLIDTESGAVQGEAHAFLAQVLLGAARARRHGPSGGPAAVLSTGVPSDDNATATGLRHLKIAQELGARDTFLWIARIHASYLLAGGGEIDWRMLVGLYENLLSVSMRHIVAPNTPASQPIHNSINPCIAM
jgi:predicted RNA polymerase sigma factor